MKRFLVGLVVLVLLSVVIIQMSNHVEVAGLNDDSGLEEREPASTRADTGSNAASRTSSSNSQPIANNAGSSNHSTTKFDSDRLAKNREAALARFQNSSTQKWDIRRDNFSSGVRTLQEGQMPNLQPEAFLAEYAQDLFGVPASHLIETRREVTDRTKIVYTQKVDGLEVYGGSLVLFYENDSLTRVQNDLASNESRAAQPSSMSAAAIIASLQASAIQSSQASGEKTAPVLKSPSLPAGADSSSREAKLIFYPASNGLVHAYQLAVREERVGKKPETYWAIVDAKQMQLIAKKPYYLE